MKRVIISVVAFIAASSSTFAQAIVPVGTVDINFTSTTPQFLVAAPTAGRTSVIHYHIISAGTTNFSLVYGTQSSTPCDTNQVTIDGPMSLTSQSGLSAGDGSGAVITIPYGQQLCAVSSVAVQIGGSMTYYFRP